MVKIESITNSACHAVNQTKPKLLANSTKQNQINSAWLDLGYTFCLYRQYKGW